MLPFALESVTIRSPVEPSLPDPFAARYHQAGAFQDYLQRASQGAAENRANSPASAPSDPNRPPSASEPPSPPQPAAKDDRAAPPRTAEDDHARDGGPGQGTPEPTQDAAPTSRPTDNRGGSGDSRQHDAEKQDNPQSGDGEANGATDSKTDKDKDKDAVAIDIQAIALAGQLTNAPLDQKTKAELKEPTSGEAAKTAISAATATGAKPTGELPSGQTATEAALTAAKDVAEAIEAKDKDAANSGRLDAIQESDRKSEEEPVETTAGGKAGTALGAETAVDPSAIPNRQPSRPGHNPRTKAESAGDRTEEGTAQRSTPSADADAPLNPTVSSPATGADDKAKAVVATVADAGQSNANVAPSAPPGQVVHGPGSATAGHASSISAAQHSQQEAEPSQVDRVRLVQRVERAFQTMSEQGGSVRLRLSPPELGSLRIEVTVRNGELSARMETETSAAKNLLLDNLPALRERLAQQDIKVQHFDVDLMDRSLGGSSDQTAQYADSQQRGGGGGSHQPNRPPAAETREVRSVPDAAATRRPGQGGSLNVVI